MQTIDIINGTFELGSGLLSWINVVALYKDKEVKGFNLWVFSFFTMWGYWNLYYYPSLNQWASFIGGIFITIANTVWLIMAIYYTYYKRKNI